MKHQSVNEGCVHKPENKKNSWDKIKFCAIDFNFLSLYHVLIKHHLSTQLSNKLTKLANSPFTLIKANFAAKVSAKTDFSFFIKSMKYPTCQCYFGICRIVFDSRNVR